MKILFCISTMYSGGAQRVMSILCNYLSCNEHKIDLMLISSKDSQIFYEISPNVNIIHLLANEKKREICFFKKILLLRKYLKRNQYDVIVSFLPNVNICVWLASLFLKNVVHVVSERNNPACYPKNFFVRRIKELSYKQSNGIVCQTGDAKEYFSKKIKKPIVIIKNPITNIYRNDFNSETSTIVSVGRLEPQKNFDLLIDAFSIFSKNHDDARLVIYGEGYLKDKLLDKIASLNMKDKIKLMGASSNWIQENLNSAFFVNSSLFEGMPNALLEAVLNKIPCIASDCPIGGSKEILSDKYGLLFENGNLEDLVCKMEMMYHNKQLINCFKSNSNEILDLYSVSHIASQWINFFDSIIKNK